jgi:hypothetical protein
LRHPSGDIGQLLLELVEHEAGAAHRLLQDPVTVQVVESCFDSSFRQDHGVARLGRFQRHRFDADDLGQAPIVGIRAQKDGGRTSPPDRK